MNYAAIKTIIRSLTKTGRASLAREKIASVFQVKSRVRNVRTGIIYTVHEVDLDSHAYLESEQGDIIMPTWITPGGEFRTEVANVWEPAPAPKHTARVSHVATVSFNHVAV